METRLFFLNITYNLANFNAVLVKWIKYFHGEKSWNLHNWSMNNFIDSLFYSLTNYEDPMISPWKDFIYLTKSALKFARLYIIKLLLFCIRNYIIR